MHPPLRTRLLIPGKWRITLPTCNPLPAVDISAMFVRDYMDGSRIRFLLGFGEGVCVWQSAVHTEFLAHQDPLTPGSYSSSSSHTEDSLGQALINSSPLCKVLPTSEAFGFLGKINKRVNTQASRLSEQMSTSQAADETGVEKLISPGGTKNLAGKPWPPG